MLWRTLRNYPRTILPLFQRHLLNKAEGDKASVAYFQKGLFVLSAWFEFRSDGCCILGVNRVSVLVLIITWSLELDILFYRSSCSTILHVSGLGTLPS